MREYLHRLKTEGRYSWAQIAEKSGISESTVRSIFSGATPNPGVDTFSAIVEAMGGELTIRKDGIGEETPAKDFRDELIESLKRDKRVLLVALAGALTVIVTVLVIDLLIGTVGWIRFS